MNAFHVLGGVLAVWAVLLAALGVTRHDFPRSRLGERLVGALTVLLVAGAVASAIVTGATEGEDDEAEAGQVEGAPEAGSGGEGTGPGQTLRIAADEGGAFEFAPPAATVKPGPVTIEMDNPSPVPHNVAIEIDGRVASQGETVDEGGKSAARAELEPGRYVYFCSVAGHREGGMEGTLTVR